MGADNSIFSSRVGDSELPAHGQGSSGRASADVEAYTNLEAQVRDESGELVAVGLDDVTVKVEIVADEEGLAQLHSFETSEDLRTPSTAASASTQSEVLGDDENGEAHNNPLAHETASQPCTSYYCHICMETKEYARDGFTLSCQHEFCRPCLESYFNSKIQEASIPIRCFHPVHLLVTDVEATASIPHNEDKVPICNREISHETILDVIQEDKSLLHKYIRFRYMKDNANARECPRCGTFTSTGSDTARTLQCENRACRLVYCFAHADAHPGETCEQYESQNLEVNRPSMELIATSTKACPGCGMAIWKNGGCNHIKCSQCQQAFCWLCLTKIDDDIFPAHFQWWNLAGTCSNLQMDDAIEPSTFTRVFATLLMVLQFIVLGPLVAACTIVSVILFGCFVPPQSFREFIERNLSNWGIVWMLILVLLPCATVAGGIVVTCIVIGIVIMPVYRLIGYLIKRGNVNQAAPQMPSPLDLLRRYAAAPLRGGIVPAIDRTDWGDGEAQLHGPSEENNAPSILSSRELASINNV